MADDVGDFDTEWDAAEPTKSALSQATNATGDSGGNDTGDDFEVEWAAAEATPSAQVHSASALSASNGSAVDQSVSGAEGNTVAARRRPPPPPLSSTQAKAKAEAQHLAKIEAVEVRTKLHRH
eukprot:COSAG02_NODE_738_length_17838_cov_10.051412_8_plen_123_part_00